MRTKPVTPMLAPEKGAVWSKFTKNKESRGGMLEYNEGYITGMGYLNISRVNTG